MVERYDKLLDGSPHPARYDIVEAMKRESDYWLSQASESVEIGDFDMELNDMTLQDIEEILQGRLDRLQAERSEGFEIPSWNAFLECYAALAQVKQAQAIERIATLLDGFRKSGFPVENVN